MLTDPWTIVFFVWGVALLFWGIQVLDGPSRRKRPIPVQFRDRAIPPRGCVDDPLDDPLDDPAFRAAQQRRLTRRHSEKSRRDRV